MRNLSKFLLAASLACIGTIANAHPLPKSASPKPNAVLAASPTEVRIGFSEGLVAAFSGIEVDDQSGKPVDTGDATLNPNDNKELIAPIKTKLMPGTYTVKWHAVGDDTHHVSGHYSFQVQP
jgi:hypothetical protein